MTEVASDPDLKQKADGFAGRIQSRLERVLPDSSTPQLATLVAPLRRGEARVIVSTVDKLGIPLLVDGNCVLRLTVSYECTTSTESNFLAIESSTFRVNPKDGTMPLFTVDYVKNPSSHNIPAAHLNVHADRDDMTAALKGAGKRDRGRLRRKDAASGKPLRVGSLHFPIGGHRFRLCLEDVLEMLVVEFGLDRKRDWKAAIEEGRQEWRRVQLAVAVGDDPETAAAELRRLKYDVSEAPAGVANKRTERLTAM